MNNKRVLIIDFNHLAHSYFHSNHRLSYNRNGIVKDTTIQNGTLKLIHKWSLGGVYPTAVCFDRPVPSRKVYFQEAFSDMQVGTDSEYKGGRKRMPDAMFEGISDVEDILRRSGVSCFSQENFESDDLVFACIQYAKKHYKGYAIDVVTNDADLLPLVDDVVSVFIRSKKGTYAVDKPLEKNHYVQVTPENYQEVIEGLSAYKGFKVPYNTLLLHKLLRGDMSDKFGRKDISRMFSAKKYNALIDTLISENYNLPEIFRYGAPTSQILYKGTDRVFNGTMEEALKSPDRSNLYIKYGNSEELDAILYILRNHTELSDEQLDAVAKLYVGMNLNQVYPHKNPAFQRGSFSVEKVGGISTFDEFALNTNANVLGIRILR